MYISDGCQGTLYPDPSNSNATVAAIYKGDMDSVEEAELLHEFDFEKGTPKPDGSFNFEFVSEEFNVTEDTPKQLFYYKALSYGDILQETKFALKKCKSNLNLVLFRSKI